MKDKDDKLPTTLKELVRRRRIELDLSQRALGKLIGVTGELICYVEAGQRRLHLDRIPALASALVCDRKELCQIALQEHAPGLFAELFAAVPLEPSSLSEYPDDTASFRAGCGTFTIDPNGSPDDFEAVD
ncbi:MAG: helix-turn-helix transcriptional regulator [Bryobacteraceae bacterium]|jgi:transcriptional regulator with XRE-family HTH domain